MTEKKKKNTISDQQSIITSLGVSKLGLSSKMDMNIQMAIL